MPKHNPSMKWKCIDCKSVFSGPTDHTPKEGYAHCGSKNVFDLNVEPASIGKAAAMGLQIVPLQYLLRHNS